jgi:tetratricopeptide (TPR) repeat protein
MSGARKYIPLIILLILAIYANSFRNEFVWDDEFLIVENPAIMSWNYAWIHFAVDLYRSFSNYYRPVQMMTYMVDFSIWRLDPFGYHLTNVLLHILVSLSLFMFIKLMTKNAKAAFIGTLFYALHPAHTAAVTYIAGRADPLSALFLLLSLLLFHRHFKSQNKNRSLFFYIGSLTAFLLALLSKEIAVVLPAIILCYRLFFIDDTEVEKKRIITKFHYISPFIIILGVYLILRTHALNFQDGGMLVSKYPLYSRLLTSIEAIGIYLGIIFFPFNLHMERSIAYVTSFFERDLLLSVLMIVLIIWLIIRIAKVSKPALFGFLFFAISLLPVMNIYPLSSNMAEHWLYIPMMGTSVFLTCVGLKVWNDRKIARPILSFFMICYFVFFSYRTFARNFDWRDEYSIYNHTFNYSPKSIKILNNLGNLYHKRGDFDRAIAFHQKAIEINPKEHKTYFNLGRDYEVMGMLDEALAQYGKSIRCQPDYAKAHFNIGNIYAGKEKYDKAVISYKRAAEYDDFHIGARNNLGNIYFERGLYEEAKEKYEEIIKIDPYLPGAHSNLANALDRLGRLEEAIKEHEKAIELEPDNATYHSGLGVVYGKLGRYDEAIAELKEAYRLKPTDVENLINLGVSYFHKGDLSSAEKEWGKVLQIDPANNTVRGYLKRY